MVGVLRSEGKKVVRPRKWLRVEGEDEWWMREEESSSNQKSRGVGLGVVDYIPILEDPHMGNGAPH